MDMSHGRKQERRYIRGNVRMRQRGLSRYPARVHDVSTGGCRVELTKTVTPGDIMWIGLPGVEVLQATVRWTNGWVAGVEFEKPLHPTVLQMVEDRIAAQDPADR